MKKPNILIIHADEHRFDCLGAYANKEVKTPNIDRLAKDGITYSRSYCPLPVCTPSRYSLFTGLHPHQHLGWTNHSTFPEALKTFPGMLKEAGYRTKAVGKMHFTPTYLDIGFTEMELAEQNGPGRYDDDYHRYLMKNNLVDFNDLQDQVDEYRNQAPQKYFDNLGAMESNLAEKDHKTTWIADRAIKELEGWGSDNNVLVVGFINPHHPFDPPAPWSEMYDPEDISLLPGWTENNLPQDLAYHSGFFEHSELTEEKMKRTTAFYYACISQIDYHVGRMIDILHEKNIYGNTMIIYTSDHGDYMGYHHMLLKQNHLYEPLVKVPLIIKYPEIDKCNQQKKGTIDERLVNNIDLAPTILKTAGIEPDENMNGLNLIEISENREYIFVETIGQREYMIRGDRYKLIYNRDDKMSAFFDLKEDPFETNNLINNHKYRKKVSNYKESLHRWLLFDQPTNVYLNKKANIINQPNALSEEGEHRKQAEDYFRKKMKQ